MWECSFRKASISACLHVFGLSRRRRITTSYSRISLLRLILLQSTRKLLSLQHDSDGKGNFRLGVFAKHIQTVELGDQLCTSSEGITSAKKKPFKKSTAFLTT